LRGVGEGKKTADDDDFDGKSDGGRLMLERERWGGRQMSPLSELLWLR